MTVKALMPARMDLVEPLAHEATAWRTTESAAPVQTSSGAVRPLIGASLRPRHEDSSTVARTRGTRTSTTERRTTTTRATKAARAPSADSSLFELLFLAYLDCRRTKRCSASAQAFEAHLEHNLCELHAELAAGAYAPGRSVCFVITGPKPREVWAAQFRDRVVHWLLYNHIAPRFHAAFTADSCACIPGRGTLYAARRLEHQVRSASANWARPAHYLKCDIANFFVSIDKAVLWPMLAHRLDEPWWLSLAYTILWHDPRANVELRGTRRELALMPPHKSLFNAPDGHGLPIGNLSSQFFANVLLDALDQHIKHRLRAPHHVRYVDDFVLVHPSAAWLHAAQLDIEAFLHSRLHLQLNPTKTVLQPVVRGIDFVGHLLKPWCRRIRRSTVASAAARLQAMPHERITQAANSYFGLMRQAPQCRQDLARIAHVLLARGKAVRADLAKAYP